MNRVTGFLLWTTLALCACAAILMQQSGTISAAPPFEVKCSPGLLEIGTPTHRHILIGTNITAIEFDRADRKVTISSFNARIEGLPVRMYDDIRACLPTALTQLFWTP